MNKETVLSLVAFFLIVFAVQAIGSASTFTSVGSWYQTLAKPSHTPPDWVFGPVWTVLYILIALAGWRVWHALPSPSIADKAAHPSMFWWAVQLIFNLLWSIIFFGMQDILLGLIVIGLLLASILICMKEFRKIDRMSALMLAPYALWVAYASTLNLGIFILN